MFNSLINNLLSISQLTDKHFKVLFTKTGCAVTDMNDMLALKGKRSENVYVINIDSTHADNICFVSKAFI